MFWIFALLLALCAALLLAWPLLRPAHANHGGGQDVEVYADQLTELDRDQATGLISAEDADYARAEIGRRLLAAAGKAPAAEAAAPRGGSKRLWVFAAIIILFVPVAGLALYTRIGNPDLPDQPLAERLANPRDDINILIAQTEAHLAENPKDGRGWELLAPIYLRYGRPADSAAAWVKAAEILGRTPERIGNSAEALVMAAQGEVTPEATKGFEAVIAMDPNDARARFYLANRLEQVGKNDEALKAFQDLAATAPKDAPWLNLVNQHIEFVRQQIAAGDNPAAKPGAKTAPLGNPTAEDMQAAEGMNANDRMAMIRTMVEGLDARLATDPANFDGWMRLVRSYMVLGEPDKAKDALKRGLAAFPATGDQGKQLLEAARGLGIPTEGL